MKRCCLLFVVMIVGCSEPEGLPGKPNLKDKFVNPSKVTDFATLFAKNCAGCHGKDGKLGPAPPLNDAIFLTIVSDEELTKVISEGRANTEMPAFAKSKGGTLIDQAAFSKSKDGTPLPNQVDQVQALVKAIRETWGKTKVPGEWPPYVATGKGDVARGKTVFAKQCAACHGENGLGAGEKKSARINDSAFLSLASEQMLRRIVITGRPDLGMPDCINRTTPWNVLPAMSAADVDDVVALLMSWK